MKNILGAVLIFVGSVCFSTKAILVKLSYGHEVDAITVLTLRMLYALPVYLVIVIWNRKKIKELTTSISNKDWINLTIMGIVGYYFASIFDFKGLEYVTAGLERLILFVYPTLVVLLSVVFLKKKIGKIEITALVLTYIGVFIVFFDDAIVAQQNVWLGSILIFGSALTYAIYLIGTGELSPKFGSVNYTAISMVISTVAVFLHYILVSDISMLFANREVNILAMNMALFSTVIPSFLITEGIRLIGSSRASIVASVGPVSTIILAYLFLNESFGFIQMTGTLIVLIGVITVSVAKK